MKKILLITTLLTSFIFANIKVAVSIAPMVSYLKAIGGDRVDISLMVQAGASPHTYEPKPSQMVAISKARLYFAIGVEFENIWLDRFVSANPNLVVIHTDANITKRYIDAHSSHSKKEKKDPHIWTSLDNLQIIATNIYKALVEYDKENASYYKANYDRFINRIQDTKNKITQILSNVPKGSKFMVFHPSWGYFADEFGLTQLAIQTHGKNPKPKELINIIHQAQKNRVKAIFTQPEFSDKSAKIIANELHILVIKVSPLSSKWDMTLIKIAKAIAKSK
jgi:zinc transport system substrate-binding protein